MPRGSSPKRERQYEHIKASAKQRGESTGRAEEIAARTVNKERARSGEARSSEPDVHQGHLLAPPGRAALASRRRRPDQGAALRRGAKPRDQGPLVDEQRTASARPRPVTPRRRRMRDVPAAAGLA